MNNTDYINKLRLLQQDLSIYMNLLPTGSSFEKAKIHAEEIALLITNQVHKLQNNIDLQENLPANPVKLREELVALHRLMVGDDEKAKFAEYIQVLDSLIIHDVGI